MRTIKTIAEIAFIAMLFALAAFAIVMILSEPTPGHFTAGMICKAGGFAIAYLLYKGFKCGIFDKISEALSK